MTLARQRERRSPAPTGLALWLAAAAAQSPPTAPPTAPPSLPPSATRNPLGEEGCTSGARCWCPLIPQDFLVNPQNVSSLLRGHTLQVVAFPEPPWAVVNVSAPAGMGWGKTYSGFEVELMLRLAAEGGFQVVYHHVDVGPDETWTDALLRNKDLYDVVAGGGWMETSDRRSRGITFTTPFADLGVVLILPKPRKTDAGFWENAFFWLRPFTWDAYPAIVACFIVPSIGVWYLEKSRQKGLAGFMETLYMGWLGLVGFGDYTWVKNWFSRMVNVCWTLLVLVLLASYTASLTNFLVQSSKAKLIARDVDEFLSQGRKACTPKGWALENLVRSKYHQYLRQLVSVPPAELSKRVSEGFCEGLLMPLDYARVMLDGGPPRTPPESDTDPEYACSLQVVGRSEVPGVGAFPAGAGNCRWFLVQVLSGLIRQLAEQHVVETLFVEALGRLTIKPDGSPRCPSKTAEEEAADEGADATVRITLPHLAGLFMISFTPIILFAIAGAVVNHVCKKRGDPTWAVDLRTLDDESIGLLNQIRKRQQAMMDEVEFIARAVRTGGALGGTPVSDSPASASLERDPALKTNPCVVLAGGGRATERVPLHSSVSGGPVSPAAAERLPPAPGAAAAAAHHRSLPARYREPFCEGDADLYNGDGAQGMMSPEPTSECDDSWVTPSFSTAPGGMKHRSAPPVSSSG
eukprot:TRINITY_DN2721_c0_g1_i2.p1 TRINITY_DN2721_c0_g1~~TRINITY_DN2721_c0_g1_i2.p1  ORF type:complete len:736 (+),score=200.71 TRINITY_DN2721_c0_g1_i2:141-2210(+)